jgi:cysteine-rich repeat protein
VSQDRLFTLAMLKKLAAPFSILAFVGAATVSSAGCSSTPDPTGSGGAGGAGASTTATSSTTSGGCTTAEQCPGTDTDCETRSCVAGVCGFTFAPAGTATASQTDGDCQASVCDGMGATTTQNDDADVLDDQNECTNDVCTAGVPENKPAEAGMACTSGGGKVCDGASKCVECISAAACPSGVCSMNNCIAASCLDKVKNNTETDVDCGGADCNPCDAGKVCATGTDCVDTICKGGLCAAATCSDAAMNGSETDVDCGGDTCATCGPDLGCKQDADCTGSKCSGSKCLPSCTDKVKNTTETDVDCGGPSCNACDDAKTCAVAADCKSKVCTSGACAAPSCGDGVQNGTESDMDCGGSCGPCNPTQMCTKGADCATGVCTGNVCQGAICNDLVKNGSETDVDCGGMCATKCGTSKVCLVANDCVSNVCTGGHCQAAICGDGVLNGAEICDDGNAVSNDGCSSACTVEAGFNCTGSNPTICAPVCGDGIKAGNEQCDDSNTTTGDGCSSACAIELGFVCAGAPSVCTTTCGDGFKAGAEACDDGNGIPNDGCTACVVNAGFICTGSAPTTCAPICGDGIKVGNEACDDGNVVAGDGCSATCTVQAGYTCTGSPSVCATICGDGIIAGNEKCDDSNLANGDCCSSTCQIEAGCEVEQNGTIATANTFSAIQINNKINGFIKPSADKDFYSFVVPANTLGTITATTIDNFLGVTCTSKTVDTFLTLYTAASVTITSNDDVDASTNYCSTLTASSLVPGTYYIEVKASSLASITTFAYTLQANLTLSVCGNGVTEIGEECDGGPTCAANCTLLPACGDNRVSGAEQCDDGNTTAGDGCSATCVWETIAEIEPNGTTAQADANAVAATPLLITGSTNITGSFATAADVDIFKVTVAATSTVRFEIFDVNGHDCVAMPTTTMKLLDGAAVQISQDFAGSSVVSGINNCAAIVHTLPAGTYYIQLATGAVGSYLFQAKFETDDGSETEPNDSKATANATPGRELVVLGAGVDTDLDWYAITLPTVGLSVRAEVIEGATGSATTCESLNLDTLLTLYNSAGASLVVDDDDGRGFCSAIDGTGATPFDPGAHNLAAGTYYLEVESFATFPYRLAVTTR